MAGQRPRLQWQTTIARKRPTGPAPASTQPSQQSERGSSAESNPEPVFSEEEPMVDNSAMKQGNRESSGYEPRQRVRARRRSSSIPSMSDVTESEQEGGFLGLIKDKILYVKSGGGGCCDCCDDGADSESTLKSGASNNPMRGDRCLKLHPGHPGTYEPEEDTMVQPDQDDWSPLRGKQNRKRALSSSKTSVQKVVNKMIEYGIVAGIVVGVFFLVNHQQKLAS